LAAAPAVQHHLWLVTLAEKNFESEVKNSIRLFRILRILH